MSEAVVFEAGVGRLDAACGDRHPVVAVPVESGLWSVGLILAEDVNELVGRAREVDAGERFQRVTRFGGRRRVVEINEDAFEVAIKRWNPVRRR